MERISAMQWSIPVYVEERKGAGGEPSSFWVRPLFFQEPGHRSEKLARALQKLAQELEKRLHAMSQDPRHEALVPWTFCPQLHEASLKLRLNLHRGLESGRFYFVGYEALGRMLYFSPRVPEVVVTVAKKESLEARAEEVLTRHFRALEKDGETLNFEEFAIPDKTKTSLTILELEVSLANVALRNEGGSRMDLFGRSDGKPDGQRELQKVGRSLRDRFPHDLSRAIGRDAQVEELARLLAAQDRRPILLVGKPKVGKTALVEEFVVRLMTGRLGQFSEKSRRDVWLVSPMRLISGMSFLGQWENRLLAILEYLEKRGDVMYIDDLLGLFTAGQSAGSDLNVAQVLKPWLEKRSLRVLGEITPEAWRVLQEKDRGFAELFHVLPVPEPTEKETLRILTAVTQHLEEQHHTYFGLESVPLVFQLQQRFGGDAAFPGKAAAFLHRLAVKERTVNRWEVLEEFRARSGLQLAFLDDRRELERSDIIEALQTWVSGQEHALHSFADVLLKLKARVNDPKRPLAAFLMLGPTGVGKTESAKALARYLFGTEERLLRYDMNEFVDGATVTRLTGSAADPEGLLTSAIRRQPFSVVLFDEIEKAAPQVFDLLLSVLDEGRLADSLGRVADFTNAIILLTSNLGVSEARSVLGFGAMEDAAARQDDVFVAAAERFFRPEFFNRLDKVIPFRSLTAKELNGIARRLIAGVLVRDGMKRRQVMLSVSDAALDQLVKLGTDPHLGARPLKRVVEREIAQPLAARLTGLPTGVPTEAKFQFNDGKFHLEIRELWPLEPTATWGRKMTQWKAAEVLPLARAALGRLGEELGRHEPSGPIELGHPDPEHARYFVCREQFHEVERLLENLETALTKPKRKQNRQGPQYISHAKPVKFVVRQMDAVNPRFDRQREREELFFDLLEGTTEEPSEVDDAPLAPLLRGLAYLQAMVAEPHEDGPFIISFLTSFGRPPQGMAEFLQSAAKTFWGAEIQVLEDQISLKMSGPGLRRIIEGERGAQIFRESDGSLKLVRGEVTNVEGVPDHGTFPAEIPGMTQYADEKIITNFRCGLSVSARCSEEDYRALLLSTLPLPKEFDVLG